jgi:demethylmenaquinone methyltransferase/2-methoxy-6-polyprenyl-1,4-benzoquinol methylase
MNEKNSMQVTYMADKKIPSRENVWLMFDRIAHRYDLLNHLLSAGQDIRWRRRLKKYIQKGINLKLLDIATGTGDQMFSLIGDKRIAEATGVDMAVNMLEQGRVKAIEREIDDRVDFREGDACNLPYSESEFDLITISFGIRNVQNLASAFEEMYRVLKPGGRVLILEFSLPSNALIRSLYLFYFRKVLPWLGGIISGDSAAYRYLNETVESFPFGQEFCNLLQRPGFTNARFVPLTFGIASLYIADKSDVKASLTENLG